MGFVGGEILLDCMDRYIYKILCRLSVRRSVMMYVARFVTLKFYFLMLVFYFDITAAWVIITFVNTILMF